MKTGPLRSTGRRSLCYGVPTTMLFAALTAMAATNYTGSGWVAEIPVSAMCCTNCTGQRMLRASVHTVDVQTSDPRTTGRRHMFIDGTYLTNGSALIWGKIYHEVGTWDSTGTNFTPTSGLWELDYRTIMSADNSLHFNAVGVGYDGAIEGLRLQETITRTNTPYVIDPSLPYFLAGTIDPPPLNTNTVVDDFSDNRYTGRTWGVGRILETNRQLTVIGDFAGTHTTNLWDSFMFGGGGTFLQTIPNNRTLEWRADLVSLDENATNAAILGVGNENAGGYWFHKARDFVYLFKWVSGQNYHSILVCDRVTTPNTNVTLALALTRVQPNLVISARVLEKTNPNNVLYECRFVDTPKVDPTVSSNQFQALTGMHLTNVDRDVSGVLLSVFGPVVGVFQYTAGNSPAPKAVFDDLELWTSEVPRIGVERSVRLSWPISSTVNYTPEAAPSLEGPWAPVQETSAAGLNQMTVPSDSVMQYFRLRQVP